jgi:hypothetical protein
MNWKLEHYEKIKEQNQAVWALSQEHDAAKVGASQAKKELERAQAELMRLIAMDEKSYPLFDQEEDEGEGATKAESDALGDAEYVNEEAWRTVKMATLSLKPKTVKTLEEGGILTVGHFHEHCAEHGDWWAKEINGCGPKMREEIETAMDAFWKGLQ